MDETFLTETVSDLKESISRYRVWKADINVSIQELKDRVLELEAVKGVSLESGLIQTITDTDQTLGVCSNQFLARSALALFNKRPDPLKNTVLSGIPLVGFRTRQNILKWLEKVAETGDL